MWVPIFAKLSAEAMLSFYPMMIQLIQIPILTQMWTRFFTYTCISAFFVDWGFIRKTILTQSGILLVVVSLIHVYTSYKGFELLESGVSYSLFYIYPILILLLSGKTYSLTFFFWCMISLLGVVFLSTSPQKTKQEQLTQKIKKEKSSNETETDTSLSNKTWGIIMIVFAAITEAWIYFIVRDIKTDNNWNHIFLSYSLGGIGLTAYTLFFILSTSSYVGMGEMKLSPLVLASLGGNAVIGLFGYLLRFYAATRLEPHLYAPLSYFGVAMAYVYGVVLKQDSLTWTKIIGTLCIMIPNLMLLRVSK
jgi:drug/metabolite transporter (DMT)-like permease